LSPGLTVVRSRLVICGVGAGVGGSVVDGGLVCGGGGGVAGRVMSGSHVRGGGVGEGVVSGNVVD
jgi:hypothetical protein